MSRIPLINPGTYILYLSRENHKRGVLGGDLVPALALLCWIFPAPHHVRDVRRWILETRNEHGKNTGYLACAALGKCRPPIMILQQH